MSASRNGELHKQSCLLNVYNRLLVDIGIASKVSFEPPDDVSVCWVLIEGPQLDKELLSYIEGNQDFPAFPEWIQPLSERFRLLKEPMILRYLRQALVFCYKAEFEPTNEQLQTAQKAFEAAEVDNSFWASHFSSDKSPDRVFTSARQTCSRVIANISWSQLVPAPGPGAVWPSCPVSEKSNWDTIYSSIEREYPFCHNYALLPSFWKEACYGNPYLTETTDITCNLVAVPKDSRGPRLICVHPKESIWIQQGQRDLLESAIESHPLTRGRINFRDQSINGSLALSSSSDGTMCTLDLKDASDRLTDTLVRYLFGGAYRWIGCARASRCRLLDGRHIRLEKYAPMGNCLTFPVQSLVFYSLVRAGIQRLYGIDCSDVYVFGDDIVFPSKYYDGAIRALASANLIVNTGKTFRKGLFRESCGVDAYNGEDVTPHRLKRYMLPSVTTAVSLCTMAKAMRMDGYLETSAFLYHIVAKDLGTLPLGNDPKAQGVYEYVNCDLEYLFHYGNVRFNRYFHRWEVPIRALESQKETRHRDDWYHLLDALLRLEGSSLHLRRSTSLSYTIHGEAELLPFGGVCSGRLVYPVPYREQLTYGWTPAQMRREVSSSHTACIAVGREDTV